MPVKNSRDPDALRELAAWYRAFAERAENPAIWNSRLCTAEHFEEEADRIEAELTAARICGA